MRLVRSLVLAAAVAGITAAGAAPAAAADGNYVALGDSYSAGTGAGNYGTSGNCLRSTHAYPELWQKAHPAASFTFLACAGATTDDVLRTQLGALTGKTTLVTMSIGGNDIGFAGVMTTCTFGTEKQCTDRIDKAKTTATAELPGKLDKTYAAIKARAPKARVVVLGYPRIFAAGPANCAMTARKRTALNAGADELANITADRARAAGLTYQDVRDEFDGHAVCTADPWINGVTPTNVLGSYHPNAKGQNNGYYRALTTALD